MLLVTKRTQIARMRARVGHRPRKRRGLGAGLIGDYRSYTREVLLKLLTVQMTSSEHRLSACVWKVYLVNFFTTQLLLKYHQVA